MNANVGFTGENGVRSGALSSSFDDIFFRAGEPLGPATRALGFDHAVNGISPDFRTFVINTSTGSQSEVIDEELGSTFKGSVFVDPDPGDFEVFNLFSNSGRGYDTYDDLSVAHVAPDDMTTVPLPAPALMLLSGLAALGGFRVRRAFSR